MSKDKKSFVTFKDIYTRITKYVKSKDIIINGEDNLYPSTVRKIIYESPTATLAVRALIDFITGLGVEVDYVINDQTGQLMSEFVDEFATSISEHYGAYIHINYKLDENLNFVPTNPTLIPYTDVRISKNDDINNLGKLYVANWEEKAGQNFFDNLWEKNKNDWFYPFNPSQSIIKEQINKDSENSADIEKALSKYRGQIFHLNLTPQFPYAMSLFHPVLNDADSESRMAQYTNSQLRNGFMGKTLAITNGLDEEAVKAIREWLGVEGAVGLSHINVEQSLDINQAVKIEQVQSQYDETKFSETKQTIKENILGCAKNLPKQLVLDSNGLFSQSGTAIQQLKLFFSQQTQKERNAIEKTLQKLGFECKIIPLITADELFDDSGD